MKPDQGPAQRAPHPIRVMTMTEAEPTFDLALRGETPRVGQLPDFSRIRSSTDFGMVVSKSRSFAQVGVMVMTTISA